jgi:hypothetical protein
MPLSAILKIQSGLPVNPAQFPKIPPNGWGAGDTRSIAFITFITALLARPGIAGLVLSRELVLKKEILE